MSENTMELMLVVFVLVFWGFCLWGGWRIGKWIHRNTTQAQRDKVMRRTKRQIKWMVTPYGAR